MLGRILLGVAASVAGSLGHSLGMTLQKRAHLRLEALGGSASGYRAWKDAEWQTGLALYLLSSTAPPTIALSILPVFVAAPLAAVGLVANAVFARYILSSTFVRTDAFGTLLVALGSCSVAVFGAIDEPPLSLEELLRLYKRPTYAAFFALYSVVVTALIISELYWRRKYAMLTNRMCQQRQNTASTSSASRMALHAVHIADSPARQGISGAEDAPLLVGSPAVSATSYSSFASLQSAASLSSSSAAASHGHISSSDNDSSASARTARCSSSSRAEEQNGSSETADSLYRRHFSAAHDVLSREAKTSRGEQLARYISGFLSAIISGLICSQTLLLAKSGIGLLVLTAQGSMQFRDPLAAAIVAGLVATALANLYYIQRALRLCSTLTVVPLCYCSSSLSALISSLVYFDQIRLLSALQIAMISVGIVLLAAGVLFLSSKTESQEGPLHLPPEDADDMA
ncbi:hypothetical protein GQ54DRAFT_298687 [Martensiomyces pterosporus]|nr:hypothetical protein GQ54DRAFT_298687 [Martensiomyces pterosporus]